jgi:hypothetical protein
MPTDDATFEGEALAYADSAGRPFLLVRPEGLDAPEPLTPVLDAATRNGFRWVIATDLVRWKVASVADRLPHNLVDFPRSPDSINLLGALDANNDVDAGLAEFVSVAPVFADILTHARMFIEDRADDFTATLSARNGHVVSPAQVLKVLRSTHLSSIMPSATSCGPTKRLTRALEADMPTGWQPTPDCGSSGRQASEQEMEAIATDEADFKPFFEGVPGIAAEEVAALAAAYRTRCDTLGIPLSKGMTEEVCAFLEVHSGHRRFAQHTS